MSPSIIEEVKHLSDEDLLAVTAKQLDETIAKVVEVLSLAEALPKFKNKVERVTWLRQYAPEIKAEDRAIPPEDGTQPLPPVEDGPQAPASKPEEPKDEPEKPKPVQKAGKVDLLYFDTPAHEGRPVVSINNKIIGGALYREVFTIDGTGFTLSEAEFAVKVRAK